MTADVDERAQHTLAVADEDDRNVAHARGGVRPRLRNLPCVSRVLPEPAKIRSYSRRRMSRSVYQLQGTVRVLAAVAMR